MKKCTILKQAMRLLLLLVCLNSFSQTIAVQMENVVYNGNSIPNCTPINLNASATHNITFNAKVDVSSYQNGPVYTIGKLIVAYYSGSAEIIVSNISINIGDWTYENDRAYLSRYRNITLSSSNFDQPNGGSLYVRYEETNHVLFQESCIYNITKPKFSISPNNYGIPCSSISPRTFTVSNDNSSPGTLSYNWQVGNGWKRNGVVVSNFTTTTNTVDLTPYNYPPDNVHVTPVLGSVALPQLTSSISLSDFNPSVQINGPNEICSIGTFNIPSLNGVIVSNWSISNSNIATISVNSNQVTLNFVANGIVSLHALLTNACGQSVTLEKNNIIVGQPTVSNHTISGGYNYQSVNSVTPFSVAVVPGATQYYWEILTISANCSAGTAKPKFNYSNSTTYITNLPYATVLWNQCPGSYIVQCYARNSCGDIPIGSKVVNVYDLNNNPCPQSKMGKDQFVLKRNPIKDGTIVLHRYPPGDPCNIPENRSIKSVETLVTLLDSYGKPVFTKTFRENDIIIPGLKLKSGFYILEVVSGSFVKRQVLIAE